MSEQTNRPSAGARIILEDITKVYPGQQAPAVEAFSMDIAPGELIMFVGPSGCGKTTTMKMINRIIEPSSGSITIDGEDVLSLEPNQLRRRIGYVIQQIGLFPHMTIAENIAIVPKLLGWDKKRTRDRVEELLAVVELDPKSFASRYPRQLSGGQQQRVGVARALAADPPVMLMDEPFGATDPITREKLQTEFLRLQEKLSKTIVFVTHDFDEAVRMGDRIAVLSERSQIEQFDTPANILANPANPYVSQFVGHGAALKRLGLIPVNQATLGPHITSRGALDVNIGDSLRNALDSLVLSGGAPVAVVDNNGRPVGSIDIERISAALGGEFLPESIIGVRQ
ncbi:osmoprotectant transport system ATP-binding protein [Arthrobacter silviterrae]|uniref:ABC transporter ATP-binding protein n=1 Tax=Arthrobacter silviterrae TaxID=2026658 RepID=A0ABX0DK59_9MICC|nr:ABC transporter ATP-binding protein [Arthrobacter silviterrae]MDQ0276484.1 osmoprotectant transport system ATP-binding protein [Arthrobacter silviterrae]NGN84678.1 ABC transporter ATP-binding protein [Arthrobacter silviterrae]